MTLLANISITDVADLFYLLAAVMFIVGLKLLSKVQTAARGNLISAVGMLIATAVTFVYLSGGELISLAWVAVAMVIGAAIGLFMALKTPMTAMPQMVALLNGFGGMASLLVASGDYSLALNDGVTPPPGEDGVQTMAEVSRVLTVSWYSLLATGLAVLIGGITFTGSLVAYGKLEGLKITPSAPIQFPGQKLIIALLLLGGVVLSFVLIWMPAAWWIVVVLIVAALVLGILLVIGIGGADMPVVVSLLNSYSGLAAAMAGFVLNNSGLIITGSLVGASGLILTSIMCRAMNRSLMNVLFGGVGGASSGGGGQGEIEGTATELTAEDVAIQLEAAQQVMIVPGYGMAVAQAQHPVKELADMLEAKGIRVIYAIHPVAGRMPGHMNVLLAEAQVPYESLLDLEGANAEFENTDVALVIGANDVTNPAARHAKDSPLYGMPILNVDQARRVVVIKRSLSPGFAGIQNELYFRENCGMLFSDGKAAVNAVVSELKEL